MGLKAWATRSADERRADHAEREARRKATYASRMAFLKGDSGSEQPSGAFEGFRVEHGQLRHGEDWWPLAGAEATVDVGAPSSRITATRLVAIGLFALAARKDTTRLFVSVTFPDAEAVVIEGRAKQEQEARRFAALLNQAALVASERQ